MRTPNFTDPQYVDANNTGGFNLAFGMVSGSITSLASGDWTGPGLVAADSMGVTLAGLVATVNLPSPWGLITSGGVIVRAHGTQTGQDTTSYTVPFSGVVPSTGSVTAYLAATVTSIQQNSFPIPGPPRGHPSFNPNFVPTVGYAANVYTVALAATTTQPDNVNSFELFRTTLTSGATGITGFNTLGWQLAPPRIQSPALVIASGGSLSPSQSFKTIVPSVGGLTFTLPSTSIAGGLEFRFVNPTNGNLTVSTVGSDRIQGFSGGDTNSVVLAPSGSLILWAYAPSLKWSVTGFNASDSLVWANQQTFVDTGGGTLAPTISGTTGGGANLRFIGNGGSTPKKWIRVVSGILQVINDAYTTAILSLTDTGTLTVPGNLRAGLGAYNSGDAAAAAILGDFVYTQLGSGPGTDNSYMLGPNGAVLQAFPVFVPVGGSPNVLVTTSIGIPAPFANSCDAAFICQLGNLPSNNTGIAISPASIGSGSNKTIVNVTSQAPPNAAAPNTIGCIILVMGH